MSVYDDVMLKPNTGFANFKAITKQRLSFLGNSKFVLSHYYCRLETILLAVAITMCNSRNSGFWESHCFKSRGTGQGIVVTHCFSKNDQSPPNTSNMWGLKLEQDQEHFGIMAKDTNGEAPGPKLLDSFLSPVLITSLYIIPLGKSRPQRASSIFL